MAFTIDANQSLTITLHEVYLALAKTPIERRPGWRPASILGQHSTRRRRA